MKVDAVMHDVPEVPQSPNSALIEELEVPLDPRVSKEEKKWAHTLL